MEKAPEGETALPKQPSPPPNLNGGRPSLRRESPLDQQPAMLPSAPGSAGGRPLPPPPPPGSPDGEGGSHRPGTTGSIPSQGEGAEGAGTTRRRKKKKRAEPAPAQPGEDGPASRPSSGAPSPVPQLPPSTAAAAAAATSEGSKPGSREGIKPLMRDWMLESCTLLSPLGGGAVLPVVEEEEGARDAVSQEESAERRGIGREKDKYSRIVSHARELDVKERRKIASRDSARGGSPSSGGPAKKRFLKTETMLGKGAFGSVYEAYDTETGRFVAMKEVSFAVTDGPDTDKQVEKITTEVMLMKKLHHPHIVQYIAAERCGHSVRIYMELVSGGSISSVIRELGGNGFPEKAAKIYTRQICRGLEYLHARNIAHRDIKGENVLLDKSSGHIKLADFNSSKERCGLSIEEMRTLAGTLWYMAPEMINGTAYGLPTDVWSLGITVVEMLTGAPPLSRRFRAQHEAMFHIANLQDPYDIPEGVGDGGCAFLHCCLLRNPADRWTVSQLCRHPFVSEVQGGGLVSCVSPPAADAPLPLPQRCSSPELTCRKPLQPAAALRRSTSLSRGYKGPLGSLHTAGRGSCLGLSSRDKGGVVYDRDAMELPPTTSTTTRILPSLDRCAQGTSRIPRSNASPSDRAGENWPGKKPAL